MYSGGTIFYDHASKLIHISNQVTLIASDTVRGKLEFERVAAGHGVAIEQYHGDNGIFKSQLWSDSCEEAGQLPTSMSGVGAHHQNAVAERSIGTVVRSARTMLLHAAIYWPEVSDLMLWPFALQYAVDIWNRMPDINTKLSPLDVFSGVVSDHTDLLNSHVWGCPTYVLDPTLQDGKKLPKWSPRKRRGQFLGWSKSHASSVALVRNLNTGSITPQFHTVMDDWFTTIARMGTDDDFTPPDGWEDLFKFNRINSLIDWDPVVDGNLPDLAIEWLSEGEVQARERKRRLVGRAFDTPPRIDPKPPDIDNTGDEIPQMMPVPEGDNSSQSSEDNETETERRYPIRSTRGI
jgi:hypothetical protein